MVPEARNCACMHGCGWFIACAQAKKLILYLVCKNATLVAKCCLWKKCCHHCAFLLAVGLLADEAPLVGLAGAAEAAALGAAAAAGLASPLTDALDAAFAVLADVEGSDVAVDALLLAELGALDFGAVLEVFRESD